MFYLKTLSVIVNSRPVFLFVSDVTKPVVCWCVDTFTFSASTGKDHNTQTLYHTQGKSPVLLN